MLFDGTDGLKEKYIKKLPYFPEFYLIAHDGRLLNTALNPGGASAVSLVEPNIAQGGDSVKVCSRLIVFAKF